MANAQLLARYDLLREVGRGGMGVVHEAHDTRLNRRVAIKALHDSAHDPERRRRFQQEARAASALNHPNIVTVHDIDTEGGVDYIVMEFVDGVPLSATIADGPLEIQSAIRIAAEIASALAAAHTAGIVHRDLKPANVMVGRGGHVKIVDFGLSKLPSTKPATPADRTETAAAHTTPGMVIGTGGYMSPEQASGDPVDARTDVFAFGIVLYEMLTGRRAFPGDSYWSTLRAILAAEVAPIEEIRPGIPPALRRIVQRCLRKDPAERYASAVELSSELTPLLTVPRRGVRSVIKTHPRAALVIGIAIAVAVTAAGVRAVGWYNERAIQASLQAIEQRVDRGRYAAAFSVARTLRQRAPGDARVEQAYLGTSYPVSIATDPDGAEILFKDFGDGNAPWERLGTSPLKNTRVPFGAVQWRIEKPGFEPIERRAGWYAAGSTRLHPVNSAPPGMVFVPGGPVQRMPGIAVGDVWMDKYEVTNRDFKKFVDAGGYRDRRWWKGPFEKDGAALSWEQAIDLFRDKTGRPGPATWDLGAYPDGQDDHPVGGVSWYEAAAFAEYAGKSLPTVPHWLRATGLPNLRDDIAAGNFASQAARPVTALKDLGAILLSAGLVASVRRNLPPEIDPVNFAPRLRLPVLMLSGRYDFLLPVDTAQKPLFDALGTPAADKRHFIFDEGHVPARTVLIRETLDWLDRRLGPVTMR